MEEERIEFGAHMGYRLEGRFVGRAQRGRMAILHIDAMDGETLFRPFDVMKPYLGRDMDELREEMEEEGLRCVKRLLEEGGLERKNESVEIQL